MDVRNLKKISYLSEDDQTDCPPIKNGKLTDLARGDYGSTDEKVVIKFFSDRGFYVGMLWSREDKNYHGIAIRIGQQIDPSKHQMAIPPSSLY